MDRLDLKTQRLEVLRYQFTKGNVVVDDEYLVHEFNARPAAGH
jgi:hypothetical protein